MGPLGRSSPLIKTLTDKQRAVEGGESVCMRSKGCAETEIPRRVRQGEKVVKLSTEEKGKSGEKGRLRRW